MRPVPSTTLAAIAEFDTCTVANAIERFGVRLRNEGFTRPGLHCVTGGVPRAIGFAATCKIRSGDPPMTGGSFEESTDWWNEIEKLPTPRIAVIEELSNGTGSVIGEVHAAILQAFQCAAAVTNGCVRDLPSVRALGFPMFARALSPSHAYAHVVEYGTPVEVFGLAVHPGDLLFGDCHGIVKIPVEIAYEIPAVASELRAKEQRIIDVCTGPGFTTDKLRQAIESTR
jgi:regulator of RNase E activity RraA